MTCCHHSLLGLYHEMRKPVFDVSNEVRHIPACVVTINCPLIIDSREVCEILKVIVVYANFKNKKSASHQIAYILDSIQSKSV